MASSLFDSDSIDPSAWLKKDRLEKKIEKMDESGQTNAGEGRVDRILLGKTSTPQKKEAPLFALLESLIHSLVQDQMKKPEELLKLNPSRRESLGRFLAELGRMPDPSDPQEALRQFVRSDRTDVELEALKQLFKQIALVQIAKAILLKSWRVHAGSKLDRSDLKDLTAALERDLRPLLNLQTSTSQLIHRNFYSWYKLTPEAQTTLWGLLESITDLNDVKNWILYRARKLSAETLGERQRYGGGFYRSLWNAMSKHKLFQPRGEKLIGFSPTLRDGCLFENSPESIEWIGFEPLSFELLFCEIRYLWERPRPLPLWVKGSGLEMSMEQQSSLLLTHCGKQNSVNQMDSISCAEIALIAEENPIRTLGRGMAAHALRKLVDEHTVLKKIKQPATTRGMYQACQTLDKLRQGGTLIWAREELLTEESGKPALQFLLGQAKVIMIADLSALMCESDSLKQDLPKAIYLLKKETRLEERKSHRPLLLKAYGNIKTDEDVGLLFDRLTGLVMKPDHGYPPEPFHLHARVSPMDQREWEQHWFNPNDDRMVDQIEELKRNSIPFGQFATIRTFNPSLHFGVDPREPNLFSGTQTKNDAGFFAWVESSKNGNEIYTAAPEKLPHYLRNNNALFWIAPLRADWGIPLQTLIRSSLTRDWFEYSVERKKGAWLIKESDLKAIPVPKHLSDTLEKMMPGSFPLSTQEARILDLITSEPHSAPSAVENQPALKGHAFVFASQAIAELEEHQGALFSLITPDEQIKYPEFFRSVLAESDLCPIHQHPLIRFTATLGPHQAIQNLAQTKFPTPGIVLSTSKGLTQVLQIQDAWLRERCFELLDALRREIGEPTWEEITRKIRLPRSPDQAHTLSQQILHAYSTEKMRRKELNHLISVCLHSRNIDGDKIGLLQ
ncbi:MAG: hypothetical protein KGP28_09620 [Bdellovibrionales bacterium]|nr:hypothetical protein [Bdellovibrionales bacterium]